MTHRDFLIQLLQRQWLIWLGFGLCLEESKSDEERLLVVPRGVLLWARMGEERIHHRIRVYGDQIFQWLPTVIGDDEGWVAMQAAVCRRWVLLVAPSGIVSFYLRDEVWWSFLAVHVGLQFLRCCPYRHPYWYYSLLDFVCTVHVLSDRALL